MTAKVPDFGNKLAGGIPLVADVKGLQLNVSLAGEPAVTPAHLVLHDWGRFQSPHGSWEECPYRRAPPRGGRPPPAAPRRAPRRPAVLRQGTLGGRGASYSPAGLRRKARRLRGARRGARRA